MEFSSFFHGLLDFFFLTRIFHFRKHVQKQEVNHGNVETYLDRSA